MRFLRLRQLRINWFSIPVACVIALLPSCSHAGLFNTLVYASLPGVPQNQTSVDVYPCSPSADALVVYVHGGGWVRGDKANTHSMPSFFSSNNVCFVSANYPLTTSNDRLLIDEQLKALSELNTWLQSSTGGASRPRAYRNIAIIGHSAGAHLVALADKRNGWNPNVKNMFLMDSSSYNIEATFNNSPPRYRALMSTVLKLDMFSPDEHSGVFKRYSPALLPPRMRESSSSFNVFIITSSSTNALNSAISLQDSYRSNTGYSVSVHELPWKHSEFPRKIGINELFNQEILERLRATAS